MHLLVSGIYVSYVFQDVEEGRRRIALHFDSLLADIDHINLAHNIFTINSAINAVLVTESSNKEHMKHFHVSLPPDEVMGGKVAGFYSFDRIRPNLTNVHARQT